MSLHHTDLYLPVIKLHNFEYFRRVMGMSFHYKTFAEWQKLVEGWRTFETYNVVGEVEINVPELAIYLSQEFRGESIKALLDFTFYKGNSLAAP